MNPARTVPASVAALLAALALGGCPASTPDAPDAAPPVDATPAAFELALSTDRLPVLQGTSASLDVTVTRHAGFTGAITVTPAGLSGGATAAPLTIAADQTTATLTVTAAAGAPHSLPTPVAIRGTSGDMTAEQTVVVTVYGPPGSLDTSFSGGRLMVPVSEGDDYVYATAIQPDGKILVAGRSASHLGDFAVIRLDRDGTLDAGFGTGGKVETDFAGGADTARAIAVQPDGKIVVAGTASVAGTGQDFALVRYTAAGQLDAGFGTGGKLTTAFGDDSDTAYALVLQADGKIVAAGETYQGTATGVDFAVARYTATGAPDGGFGTAGKVITAVAASSARDSVYAVTIAPIDGEARIVVAGGEGDFELARYRANGTLDASFGDGGKVLAVFGSVIGAARAVTVTGDGKLVIAGHREHDFALVRLTSAGKLDPAFDGDGRVVTAVEAANSDEAEDLALDADGKLVVAGWAWRNGSSSADFVVARYQADGALDRSFAGGVVVTPVGTGTRSDQAMAVALQADPRVPTVRVVAAGYANASNNDFAVARYWR